MKEIPTIAKWLTAFFILIISTIIGSVIYLVETDVQDKKADIEHIYELNESPKNTCLPEK